MKRLAILIALGTATAFAQQPDVHPTATTEQEVFTIGTQAYIYGLPVVNMYLKRQEHLKLAPVNQFRHIRDVITPDMGIVSPNVDVLYSLAWLDLRQGPVILTITNSHGRYFSFQAVTFFTDNGGYASARTEADEFRKIAYVGPGWQGTLPQGVQRMDCETTSVGLIGRTFVAGTNDLAAARELQNQYNLTPLVPATPAAPYPQFDSADPLSFFAIMDEALRQNPPPPNEAAPLKQFKKIGITAATPFRVDEANRAGLTRALEAGKQAVAERAKNIYESAGGWAMIPVNTGRYGTNYLFRAAMASLRLGVNSPRECFYAASSVDQEKKPLVGTNRYVLRFEKDRLPPAKAFWSVTLYQLPERELADSRANLHSLDKTLQYGPDGALEIILQKDSPGPDKEGNWLPTPDGEFRVVLRLYDPPLSVIQHKWHPPAVHRR